MADLLGVVPYHDPYENSYNTNDILNILNGPSLTFADLSLIGEPFMHPSSSVPLSNINNGDANDPLDDPYVWNTLNTFNAMNSQTGPSLNYVNTSNQEWPENDNYGNTKPLVIWPVPPVPYLCSCCLVLREIIHTNGHDTTKLEIHGRLGMICHAILEIRQSTSENQHQMLDFCKKSIEDVKIFLVQYCEERKQAGFFMLPDPLSIFYDALCVGLDLDETLTRDDFSQPPVVINSGVKKFSAGANAMMDQVEMVNESDVYPRTSLSVQHRGRERESCR